MGSARETAVLTLAACEKQGAWSDVHLKRSIREQALTAGMRRCVPGCAMGCCKTSCCWTGGWPGYAP